MPPSLVLLAAGCSAQVTDVSQVHLALGGDATTLVVSWAAPPAPAPPAGEVRFGTDAAHLTHTAAAAPAETYLLSELQACNATTCTGLDDECLVGWEEPGWLFHAHLTNLTLGTDLYYQVRVTGAAAPANVSAVLGPVHIGPKPCGEAPCLSFVALGDYGAFAGSGGDAQAADANTTRALAAMADDGLDVVVHVGDLAYSNEAVKYWREWLDEISPIASRLPWMVACGNHDCLYRSQDYQPGWLGYFEAGGDGGECAIPYTRRFFMPGEAGGVAGWREASLTPAAPRNNVFYSFDLGPVHFALISSEHDTRAGSPQLAWLGADLAAVDRSRTPFVVFGLHRPLYSSTLAGPTLPEHRARRSDLEPVLVAHGVDLVVAGHYHQYERSCNVVGGKCDAAGPVHMTVGNAGPDNAVPWGPKPGWAVARSLRLGVARFDVVNASAMRVRAVAVDGSAGAAATIDEFVVASHAAARR